MDFMKADQEEVRRAHERLRVEHAVLVETFEQNANGPPDAMARREYLGKLHEHVARL